MDPMMKSVARHHHTQTQNSSSTFVGSDIIAPYETNTQAYPALSDMFTRLACKLGEFQFTIQTPNARAAALSTAHQDIDAAKRLILSMLTYRNMLVPISILPAEVLARIFHFTAFLEQPHLATLRLSCVYFTHVCRRWRQIALDDPTLWTCYSNSRHSPRNKEWIVEQLSRARNAPLVINLVGWMGEDMSCLFTPHISHTRELYLRNFLNSEIVQQINNKKAPVLERLEVSMMDTARMDKHHSFFKGPLPELRILCISNICFPWSLVPRVRLTQLKVTYKTEVETSEVFPHYDVNQLIDFLADCPALEVLMLKNCLPATLSESSGRQSIHLPQLSQLCLDGTGSRITNLLKILNLPPSTTLRLNCTSENTAAHILPFLSAHFNNPTPVEFRSFKITLADMGYVINMITSTFLPIFPISYTHAIQSDSDPELSLSFKGHHFSEFNNRVDILRRTCNVLSFSNLEFLYMYSLTPNQFINWSEIFRHCTEVTTVKVHGRGTIGLLQALTPPKRTDTTDDGTCMQVQVPGDDDNHGPAPMHAPIFPKLTSLLLESLDFADAVPGLGVLYDLIMRMGNEIPLTTLCIDRCKVREKPVKAFERLVRDFRWVKT